MKTASIETIGSIRPHPNADRLEIATILGWQCVVKRGEFTPDQRVVFVAPDTLLPRAPWSEFLDKCRDPIRLRTVRLRGEYSQGLVLPLSVLPAASQTWNVGADVGGELGIRKYEKEIPACLSGIALGGFPSHLAPRTDEDNYQAAPDQVAATLALGCTATVKLDGSSGTIIVRDGVITHVCSRNLSLKESDANAFWRVARKLTLRPSDTFVLQGELMGPGIQGNGLGLTEPTLYAYQSSIQPGVWESYNAMRARCAELGCGVVPWHSSWFAASAPSIETLQRWADECGGEGLVIRPTVPRTMGNGRPLGFKVLSRAYDSDIQR